ncbi:MAG TPA: hypothetical protein VH640_26585 [Bryobacteraceae bacterium]|jgi:hypothetical protein
MVEPPEAGQVIDLLKEALPDWTYEFTDLIQFRFEPLVSGKIFLLVSTPNPKAEDGGLDAIYCQQNRCFHDSIPMLVDLATDLADVDGDGLTEITARDCAGDCSGALGIRWIATLYTSL